MKKTVTVVGAGVTGVLTAYYLVKAGYKVIVVDREHYPAMRTSFANGGQVSVSNSEVWNTWSNVAKGIKWIFTKDAPLLIRPYPTVAKIKWLSKFLWHTVKGVYAENTAETIRLGLESRKLYQDIITEENLEFDQSDCGILHFYKDSKYFKNAVEAKHIYNDNGCEWDILTSRQTTSLDPALGDIEGVLGGVFTKSDWTGDIHKFCVELSKVLIEKYGVEFKFNQVFDDDFEVLVICAGVGSVELGKRFGDVIPIYPVKGYSITINVRDEHMKYVPKISLLDDQAKIVTSTLGNRFRVAGTAELNGEDYDIVRDRIEPLLNWIHENFPKLDTSDYSSWACLRPMTPNMIPIVKKSQTDNVFYNTGHGHLGWTLSPATAKQLVELINEQMV